MNIALAHDDLIQYGGAERVVDVLHDLYPGAPLYTAVYAKEQMPAHYRRWTIRTSFMQRLPGIAKLHQLYMPLYPVAFERFDLSAYDVVLSSSSRFAKGVITQAQALHVCYCHAPMRFAWNYHDYMAGERASNSVRFILPMVLNYVRLWDEASAGRVDAYIANSRVTARRIRKRYRRQATIINPPVNTSHYAPRSDGSFDDYFLIVSRLIPYKRIDLAVDAFTKLGLPLKIVGRGRQEAELRASAGPNVEFLGSASDAGLKELYAGCKAFIFPGEEDFGISPLEAQAAGRPVIAYGAGGALETVLPGVTGEFFSEQTPEALAEVISGFNPQQYNPQTVRQHAEGFDTEVFKRKISEFINVQLWTMRET